MENVTHRPVFVVTESSINAARRPGPAGLANVAFGLARGRGLPADAQQTGPAGLADCSDARVPSVADCTAGLAGAPLVGVARRTRAARPLCARGRREPEQTNAQVLWQADATGKVGRDHSDSVTGRKAAAD